MVWGGKWVVVLKNKQTKIQSHISHKRISIFSTSGIWSPWLYSSFFICIWLSGIFREVMTSCIQHLCWWDSASVISDDANEAVFELDCHQLPTKNNAQSSWACGQMWHHCFKGAILGWGQGTGTNHYLNSESNYNLPLQKITTYKDSTKPSNTPQQLQKELTQPMRNVGMKHRQNPGCRTKWIIKLNQNEKKFVLSTKQKA